MFLDISFVFYRIPIWLFFMIILTIHLSIPLGTLLARENIEETFWFFQIRYADVVRLSLD